MATQGRFYSSSFTAVLLFCIFTGVYTTAIDSQQQRVTVTGNVEVQTLIKKLTKTGKHAEMWPEKLTGKAKNKGREKEKHLEESSTRLENLLDRNKYPCSKVDEAKLSSVLNTANDENDKAKTSRKAERENSRSEMKSPEGNSPATTERKGSESTEGGGSAEKSVSKKKKIKGQKGNRTSGNRSGSTNSGEPVSTGSQSPTEGANQGFNLQDLNHTRQSSYAYPPNYNNYYPLVYVASYSSAHPSKVPGPYNCPSGPYTYPNTIPEMYETQLGSFEIFSDENVNGCFIM